MTATAAPALTFLWESGDPQDALTRRFGHADTKQASEWLRTTLATHWGIAMTSCERIVISAGNALGWVTTDSGRLIAKWSAVQRLYPQLAFYPKLAGLAELTAWLDERGIPVSAPHRALDGRQQVEVDGISMGVQSVIEGELLDVADRAQVHAAGAVLARLHLALADYPDAPHVFELTGRSELERPSAQVTSMLDGMKHDPYPEASKALREFVGSLESEPLLPGQLVHHDFRSANVLWAGSEVAAVLDGEEAGLGCCVADLARSAIRLGTRYHNWAPISPDTRETFIDGYRSARPLSAAEEFWLAPLLLLYGVEMIPPGDDPADWRNAAGPLLQAFQASRAHTVARE